MNIEELEQDYKDDEKAFLSALEELKNSIDWVVKWKVYRDVSFDKFKKAQNEKNLDVRK